ncbi:BamA/TamA family outer membrane protein [bacterium]|jgi:outer membrane protein assembly factor BamA|nr:BamA/TamA family outer membrane protein [bacterium]
MKNRQNVNIIFRTILGITLAMSLLLTPANAETDSTKDQFLFPVYKVSNTDGVIYGLFYYESEFDSDKTWQWTALRQTTGYDAWTFVEGIEIAPKWEFHSEVTWSNTSEPFFGNGNSTQVSDQASIARDLFDGYLGAYYSFTDQWKAVVRWVLKSRQERVSDNDDQRYFSDETTSGPSLGVIYDSRDTRINSTDGSYLSQKMTFFGDGTALDVDWRHFIPVGESTLALRGVLGHSLQDNPSYLQQYHLGSFTLFRGADINRFLGESLVAAQVEYRMPFIDPVYLTWFSEWGQVADDIRVDDLHWSYGLGLHYRIGMGTSSMRMDIGQMDGEGTTMYLSFDQVF